MPIAIGGRDEERGELGTYDIGCAVPEHVLGGRVEVDHEAVRVHRDDRVLRGLQDRALAGLAFADHGFDALALDELSDPTADRRHHLAAAPGRALGCRG